MTTFKLVISDPKQKKAYQVEIDKKSSALVGKKIGDTFDGGIAKLVGYKIQITGGSDQQGFPMRADVEGSTRKRILLAFGPGFHPRMKGQRKRMSIRGNTVSLEMAQINAKVVEYGKDPIEKLLGKKDKKTEGEAGKETPKKETKEEKKEEPKKEEAAEKSKEKPKEEAKKEEKPAKEAVKEEKPAEKPKEEPAKKEEPKEEAKK